MKGTSIVDLDRKDRLLLKALERNSRASLVALAREIDLSRSATHDRIMKLEELGIIKGYTIRIAREALPEVRAFLTLKFANSNVQAALVDEIKAIDGVSAVYCVSGDIDAIVYCLCDTSKMLSDLRDLLSSWDGLVAITTRHVLASSID